MSIGVVINPGSGPIAYGGAGNNTCRQATKNMRAFIRDMRISGHRWGRHGLIDGGRYGFVIKRGGKFTEIEMPGLMLDRVRYLGLPSQNAWHFPRLYVDGSSWLWTFAVAAAMDTLGLEVEAEQWRSDRQVQWRSDRQVRK